MKRVKLQAALLAAAVALACACSAAEDPIDLGQEGPNGWAPMPEGAGSPPKREISEPVIDEEANEGSALYLIRPSKDMDRGIIVKPDALEKIGEGNALPNIQEGEEAAPEE